MGSRIGPAMQIVGDIAWQGSLQVAGTCQGSLLGGDLAIEAGGLVSGLVEVDNLDCAGSLQGEAVVSSCTLRRGASQSGRVTTDQLSLEPGVALGTIVPGHAVPVPPVKAALLPQVRGGSAGDLHQFAQAYVEENLPCCMAVPGLQRAALFDQICGLLEKGKPLIRIVGEPGSGKTRLAAKLAAAGPAGFTLATISGREGGVAELLADVARVLGHDGDTDMAQHRQLTVVREALQSRRQSGMAVVLQIDDADRLYPATLEGLLRLLTRIWDVQEETIQMVLFGGRELIDRMQVAAGDYFVDETNCQLELGPLSLADTADYLRHCLGTASLAEASAIWPAETIKTVHDRSGGKVAEINRLAAQAMERAVIGRMRSIPADLL